MKGNNETPDTSKGQKNESNVGLILSFVTFNLMAVLLSYYSTVYFLIIPVLSFTIWSLDLLLGLRQHIYSHKWYKLFTLGLLFRKLKKQSQSINHSQTLISKFIHKIPIEDDETELKSFIDIKNFLKTDYPFMKIVKNTGKVNVNVEGKDAKCISSYAYLDLGRDERVQDAAIQAAREYQTGNHGPRMLCGNLEILENLEVRISKFFKKDGALVFSSGFLACMSAIAGYCRKNDLLVMDKLCHSSLRTGAKLTGAKIVNFKHNDFKDAERVINQHLKGRRLIMIIEGIYSMDGDVGNLPEARRLCDKHNGFLILDEAHSLGSLGATGRGTEEHYEYKYKADVICGSFTKSISSVGGYLTCSKDLRDFYTFYSVGVVFSAPLSAYHAGAADKAFEIIENEPQIVKRLQDNGEYLRKRFRDNGFNIGESISCVIPVIFRDAMQCIKMHRWLLNHGYFTSLVMAPACALDAPRFRITVISTLTKQDMDDMIDIFCKARENFNDVNPELEELFKYL
jgi:7-keto-8-aminopelargonate synthetase-like enzyme